LLLPLVTIWPTVTMSVDRIRVGRLVFKALTVSLSVLDGTRYRCRCIDVVVGYKGGIVLIVRRSVGRMALRPVLVRFPDLGIISKEGS